MGSFLAGVVPAAGLAGAYSAVSTRHCLGARAGLTLPPLRRPKNEVMAGDSGSVAADSVEHAARAGRQVGRSAQRKGRSGRALAQVTGGSMGEMGGQ